MTNALMKRQRWVYLLTLINLVLIAAIGATLWQDKATTEENLLNLDDINTMQWRRAGFDDIVFNHSDDHWSITTPCSLPVNRQRLEPLLDALAKQHARYSAESVDLVATGLASPLAILVIDAQEVAIGEKDLSGEYRYLKHADNVALIPEWVLSLLNSGLTGIAELEVFNKDLTSLVRTNRNAAADSDERQNVTLDSGELASLSANQIVVWPIPDMPKISGSVSLEAMYRDGQRETLELILTNSFAAIRRTDSACAYLLLADAVPDSLMP